MLVGWALRLLLDGVSVCKVSNWVGCRVPVGRDVQLRLRQGLNSTRLQIVLVSSVGVRGDVIAVWPQGLETQAKNN